MPKHPNRSTLFVALSAFCVFTLPIGLFLLKFPFDAPFYFFAEDSFYYLSIALHSARTPFFSIDGLHATNGFHPLWELFEYGLSKTLLFRLDGPNILTRLFAINVLIVGVAVSLFSSYVHRLTRRPWLAVLAVCPGLLWLATGVGAPAYLNFWSFVNGMETGLDLLFFAVAVHLFGTEFRVGLRYVLGALALGLMVLSRLDDVFVLVAIGTHAVLGAPVSERSRRLVPFGLPALMIAAYLLYNHHTVGVWMPVSGMAKASKGYGANLRETLQLVEGWPFFAMPAYAVAFTFGNVFVMMAQMIAPMAVAAAFLLTTRRGTSPRHLVLQSLAAGVLLKGTYNFVRVPFSYQGAWYYGASVATANILLAVFASEALRRWGASIPACAIRTQRSATAETVVGTMCLLLVLCLSCLSFNVVASQATQHGFAVTRDAWLERARVTDAIRSATSAPFLEFQDGQLSFETGLPSVSGFGLAADPEAVRAQRAGTFFDLLAQRGVTVAAASNTYPGMLADSQNSKAVFAYWGFNRKEVQNYCFEPFWTDPVGNVVLYRIRHQPRCPAGLQAP